MFGCVGHGGEREIVGGFVVGCWLIFWWVFVGFVMDCWLISIFFFSFKNKMCCAIGGWL